MHTYLWLKWPWATHTEPWLLLRRHSCWPCPLTPLSLWICKEFLITLYVWSALNSCVKLCTLKHITPQLQALRAVQVYQGNTSVVHDVLIFSFLWVSRIWLVECVARPGKKPRLHSHFFSSFFLNARSKNRTKIFHFIYFSLQSFSFLNSHCTLITFTRNNTRICHR